MLYNTFMIIAAISDTHGELPPLDNKDCSAAFLCGDIFDAYDHGVLVQQEFVHTSLIPWIKSFQIPTYIVGGNHDILFERYGPPEELLEVATYLQDDSTTIESDGDTFKVWGSPWTHKIGKWAFDVDEMVRGNRNIVIDPEGDKHRIKYSYAQEGISLSKQFAMIPEDTDILITHSPPYGIKDSRGSGAVESVDIADVPFLPNEAHWGSPSLRKKVAETKPTVHLFGHSHNSGIVEKEGTLFANVSYLDDDYEIADSSWTYIEIEGKTASAV
mgnify:CR=1 FL=1